MKKISNIILLLVFCAISNLSSKNYAILKRGIVNSANRVDLIDSFSEIILDSNDEIRSDIYLNNGTARLEDNTKFFGNKFFQQSGTVNLQTYDLFMGRYNNTITSTIYWDGIKGTVLLDGRTYLTSSWTFSGACILNGNNNILDLTNTGSIIIEKGSILKLKNIQINNMHGENINNLDDSCHLVIENVTFGLSDDFDFNCGSCEIYKYVDINGTSTFFYDSTKTITIHSNSICKISKELNLAIRTKDWSAGNKPIWFTDKSSEIRIDSAGIKIGPAGINFTRGWMGIHGKIDLQLTGTTQETGFKIGDGTNDGDFEIVFYPASTVKAHAGAFIIDCVNPYSIKSLSGFSKLHRLPNNDFYIKNNFVMDNLSVYIQPPTNMYVDDGCVVNYRDCKFMLDDIKFATTSSRYSDSVLLLSGDQKIFIQEGLLPFYIMVSGTGNKIHGTGTLGGEIILTDSNSSVDISLDGQVLKPIQLNGGKSSLSKDANFGQGVQFTTTGTVALESSNLNLGSMDMNCSSTLYFDSVQSSIDLNSMLTLSGSWTFSGYTTLNGNGNVLNLKPSAKIYIERGSTLRLLNLTINDLATGKLQCLDDAGTLVIKDCNAMLYDDFDFDTGKLFIDHRFDVKGDHSLIYSSREQSTINMFTNFKFFPGTTFSYSPQIVNRDLIKFTDLSSKICLDGATLHSTTTGMQLTNGTLEVNNLSYISSDATCKAEGIILGNGIDENNNINIDIIAGATLDLISGYMIYKNVN